MKKFAYLLGFGLAIIICLLFFLFSTISDYIHHNDDKKIQVSNMESFGCGQNTGLVQEIPVRGEDFFSGVCI